MDVRPHSRADAALLTPGLNSQEQDAHGARESVGNVVRVDETSLQALSDFSLVSGGLLYQFWRRMRLSGDALQLMPRRVLAAALLAWVPLLLLSIAEGRAWGGGVALTFLRDIETHVRFLIAVPLLLLAEVKVHERLHLIVRAFVEHGLISDTVRSQFDGAIRSAIRLRNSAVAEGLLLAFAYSVGVFIWRTQVALDVSSWYAALEGGRLELSKAGWWAALVSMPLVQFLMLRWYFRLLIWARFLWQCRAWN
jgi:hypothetical protein